MDATEGPHARGKTKAPLAAPEGAIRARGGPSREWTGFAAACSGIGAPGVVPSAAAQSAPDKGIFEAQYLSYRDWQPGT